MGSFLGIYIVVGFRIMGVFLSVKEVVAVQDDEMEVALVERIIASGHVHALGIFLIGVTVHIVIADDVMFAARETVPQVAVHQTGAIQPTEVAQFDDEIHIFVLGGLDKGCHTLFAIGDIGCMEVGSNGKPDGPFRDPLVGATCGQECQAKWVFRPIPFSGTSNTFLPCSKASFTCLS